MNTIKKLINEIRNNSLDTLAEKYKDTFYIQNEYINNYEWIEKSVKLYHIIDNTYSLEYFYEDTRGEKNKFYKKSVVFSKTKYGNEFSHIEITNNHTYWEGIRKGLHTNLFTNKVCFNIDNLWKASY